MVNFSNWLNKILSIFNLEIKVFAIGKIVKILEIPKDLDDEDKQEFEKLIGHNFIIIDMQTKPNLIEIDVSNILEKERCIKSVWIEPEYIEII